MAERVDRDKLARMISGWDLGTYTTAEIDDAVADAEGWLDTVVLKHAPVVHSDQTLTAIATKRAACYLGLAHLGGHVSRENRPLYMSVCDDCERFEKLRQADLNNTLEIVTIPRGA